MTLFTAILVALASSVSAILVFILLGALLELLRVTIECGAAGTEAPAWMRDREEGSEVHAALNATRERSTS